MKRKPPTTVEHRIEHSTSTIIVALVQIEGPLPKGKQPALVETRETFLWASRDEAEARVNKARSIISALASLSPRPDIVVFPEYSLPLEMGLPVFQEMANKHNLIIIPGSDNLKDPRTGRMVNSAAVLVPKLDPIWIGKKMLSQWESGFVDPSDAVAVPVLTWQAGGRTYWVRLYICLDFLSTVQDPVARAGGGLILVPMCSPEVSTFRTYANVLLGSEAGTATVFCNCVGQMAAGQSCVMAMTASGEALRPAFALPQTTEAVGVVEIDCAYLAPPKKSVPGRKWPIGSRHRYDVQLVPGGADLIAVDVHAAQPTARGVINPALFKVRGKKMRVAFLPISDFVEVRGKIKERPFETLAILGQHDLMITHLHHDLYSMIYEVSQILPQQAVGFLDEPRGDTPTIDGAERFPHFQVDTYFKVLGVPILPEHRDVLDLAGAPLPGSEELLQVLQLGVNWDDPTVPVALRNRFVQQRWLLGHSLVQPGTINAVLTIRVDFAGRDIDESEPLRRFEASVVPELVKRDEITSIYGGTGHRLSIHYLLRIRGTVDSLFDLIESVHVMARAARLLITTATYVVMAKLSDLPLAKSILIPVLSEEETFFFNTRILSLLPNADRGKALQLTGLQLKRLVAACLQVHEAVDSLRERAWFRAGGDDFYVRVARGVANEDCGLLREPHSLLHGRLEQELRAIVRAGITDSEWNEWKKVLGVPSGKSLDILTFPERLKVLQQMAKSGRVDDRLALEAKTLDETFSVRNAYAHGRFEEVTVDAVVQAIVAYARWLAKWEATAPSGTPSSGTGST